MASMSLQAAQNQARQWLETGEAERAAGFAQHMLEQTPDNLETARILGEAYLKTGDLDRAQQTLERVIAMDPEHIPAHVLLGMLAERRGQLKQAIAEYEQALEIKPDYPELRSQLLRLYTEAWGSEHAQLRLSRAGLARLYIKGHMLPQAIAEFRQVIAEQPSRYDARVALARALWKNGQEPEAAETSRSIIADHPQSLIANLILGYQALNAGRAEGTKLWQTASAIDPEQGAAAELFEDLPAAPPMPSIPDWDEQAWHARNAAPPPETMPPTRAVEQVTPAAIPATLAAPVAAPPAPARQIAPPGDDFLASLLALDSAPKLPPTPAPIVDEPPSEPDGMLPFSLNDLEIGGELAHDPAPEATQPPLSLDDLGVSNAQIAGLEQSDRTVATPAPEISETQPFSLSELGLSDDEIAGLESVNVPAAQNPAAPVEPSAPASAEPMSIEEMKPFSFADLGLSDDEIAALEQGGVADTSAVSQPIESFAPFSLDDLDDVPSARAPGRTADDDDADASGLNLTPFSLDDLDFSAIDSAANRPTSLPSSLQSFSLDDLPPDRPRTSNLADDDTADLPPMGGAELEQPLMFGWHEPPQKDEPDFAKTLRARPPVNDENVFARLQEQRKNIQLPPSDLPDVSIAPEDHLGMFSMDDVSLRDDSEGAAATLDQVLLPPPAAAPLADIASEDMAGAISAGEIQPFSFADLGLFDEEIAALGMGPAQNAQSPAMPDLTPPVAAIPAAPEPAATAPTADVAVPAPEPVVAAPAAPEPAAPAFSHHEPEPEVENLHDAIASGEIQPFSFADLGLSDEEIAALGLGAAPQAAPEPAIAASAPAAPEPAISHHEPEPEVENLQDAIASGEIQPFSFADLGLSDEEIAALGLGAAPQAAPEPAAQPAPAAQAALENEEDLSTFELDLPTWDMSELGGDSTAATSGAERTNDNLPAPFSLADIGLGDEPDTDHDDRSDRLSLTEAELADLGTGGDLAWANQRPAPTIGATPAASTPAQLSPEEALLAKGRAQGFVDIKDIIAAVDNPNEEVDRIEELGRLIHSQQIAIHDGDEVIDMDAEYEEPAAQEPVAPPAAPETPEMTPFSLYELGLSDAEIESLGLADATSSEPTQTPSNVPFSLGDLGLDDFAMPSPAVPSSPVTPSSSSEVFSLEDLIEADLPVFTQPAAPTPPVPPAPPAAPATVPPAAERPVTQPLPPLPAAPQPVVAQMPVAPQPAAPAEAAIEDPALSGFFSQLAQDPANHVLRLAVARFSGQTGRVDVAVQQYKDLIRRNAMLDDVIVDIQDIIDAMEGQPESDIRKMHRTLGDAYSRQGRINEAMSEYSWPIGRS